MCPVDEHFEGNGDVRRQVEVERFKRVTVLVLEDLIIPSRSLEVSHS